MMIFGAKDLASAFRTVRANTLVIASEFTKEQYSFSPANGSRTAGQTLIHIATISELAEQIHMVVRLNPLEGHNFPAFMRRVRAEEQKPRTKAEIVTLLTENGNRFSTWLETLSDDFLAERVDQPPGASPVSKTRFEMLLGVKEHEMHHRSQ